MFMQCSNVNGSIFKTDELRDITNCKKRAILVITESKLDSSFTDTKININGYRVIRNDKNRNGESVPYYLRNDLCFNNNNIISYSIELFFKKILVPKVMAITIGMFHNPNANDFLNTFTILKSSRRLQHQLQN